MSKIYMLWQRLEGRSGHEVGWQLLAQLYQRHAGAEMPEIRITPMGKPCFSDSVWHFSISHSKKHAFCVLADTPVGIDAEELSRKVRPSLAEKILSPEELAQYEVAEDKNRALLTFWVLKEATAKYGGDGIRVPVNYTKFTLTDCRVQEVDGCLVAIVRPEEGEIYAV